MVFDWTVIGAGPAGIAAVGKLLDHGVAAKNIAWIDPTFTVGDFGTLWRNVPSNTKVKSFLRFLAANQSFDFQTQQKNFALTAMDPEKTCDLHAMAEPLQWITNHLCNKVQKFQEIAENIALKKRTWQIKLKNSQIQSKHVILAIGAEPKKLAFPQPVEIPLHDAMDSERIKLHCDANDTIAVFGSSHSAVLVLKNLVELSVKQIKNFYRSPLLYAVYMDDWILFDNTGLKGPTAEWAHQHLDGDVPNQLQRVYANEENIEHHLPECSKVIYAVGFERRNLPVIEGLGHLSYIEQTGIIAPGLFGFGIAFPEAKYNPLGMLEYRVGLWKFMEYLEKIMPVWLNYSP